MNDDAAFDAAFAELGGVEPPETLARETLEAVNAARRSERRRSFLGGFAVATAMAAGMALFFQGETPAVADPGNLVPRGVGVGEGKIDLRVVVERGGGSGVFNDGDGVRVERFAEGKAYTAGDVLRFRVDAPEAGTATLKRNGVELFRAEVPAGESDLAAGYALEAGEKAAVFSVEIEGKEAGIRVAAVAP